MGRKSVQPRLREGQVYRTADLARWSANPSRLAARLVREGRLRPLSHGLYTAPKTTRFGEVPPDRKRAVRALLKSDDFLFTGPEVWNSLGLSSTAMHASPLVYNKKRTGEFTLGDRTFRLRRVAYPKDPSKEWFVVDLLQNHVEAGVSLEELASRLRVAVTAGRFDPARLVRAAERFGTRKTQAVVEGAVLSATSST